MIGLSALVATVAGCGAGPDTGFAPPTDADGDHVYTPDDCDDANDLVYPGAPEYCDAVDQDCDGEPLSDGGCAQQAPLYAMVSGLLVDDENISAVGLVPDLTGDLAPDLRTIGVGAITTAVYERSRLEQPSTFYDEAHSTVNEAYGAVGFDEVLSGDVDGDGASELVMLDHFAGDLRVWRGPLAGGEIDWYGTDWDWLIARTYDMGYFGHYATAVGDINDDGCVDFAWNGSGYVDGDWIGLFDVVFGGDTSGARYAEIETAASQGLTSVGDVDGDGVLDLIAVEENLALIEANRVAPGMTTTLEDIASTLIGLSEEQASNGGGNIVWGRLGDTDGDGYGEIYVGLPTEQWADDEIGQVYFFEAPFDRYTSFDDADGTYITNAHEYLGEQIVPFCRDASEDPSALLITAASERIGYLVEPAIPPGLHTPIDEARHVEWETSDTWFYSWTPVDFDGDGVNDLAAIDERRGHVGWIPGFIPSWDDDRYW